MTDEMMMGDMGPRETRYGRKQGREMDVIKAPAVDEDDLLCRFGIRSFLWYRRGSFDERRKGGLRCGEIR